MYYNDPTENFSPQLCIQLNPLILNLFLQHGVQEETLTPEILQCFIQLSNESSSLAFQLLQYREEYAKSLEVGSTLVRLWSQVPMPVKILGTSTLGYKFYQKCIGKNQKMDVVESTNNSPVPIADISELFPSKPITHFQTVVSEGYIQYIPMSGPF